MDNKLFSNKTNDDLPEILEKLKEVAIKTNKKFASMFGISQAGQVTLVKPSGTVSQLTNSSSGLHPRFSPYYIRRVRIDKKDPVSTVLMQSNIPHETDNLNESVNVFSFPIKSPTDSVLIKELDVMQQLEHWLIYRNHWCEGNPSVTIYVKEDEWLKVGAWVYENFNDIGGLSFFPTTDHIYKQAPYEEIDKEKYTELFKQLPESIDWDILSKVEEDDETTSSHEFACTSGACEL